MSEIKPNIDLTKSVKFQTQFDSIFGDRSRQQVACARASKKMITDAGFKTVDSTGRIDTVIYDSKRVLTCSTDIDKARLQLIKNFDEGKPTLVAVNRSTKAVGNANKASNHYVVIVGRSYNADIDKYEYRFYDPGTSYQSKGTSYSNIFVWNGIKKWWEGVSNYCGKKYIITEIRPTL